MAAARVDEIAEPEIGFRSDVGVRDQLESELTEQVRLDRIARLETRARRTASGLSAWRSFRRRSPARGQRVMTVPRPCAVSGARRERSCARSSAPGSWPGEQRWPASSLIRHQHNDRVTGLTREPRKAIHSPSAVADSNGGPPMPRSLADDGVRAAGAGSVSPRTRAAPRTGGTRHEVEHLEAILRKHGVELFASAPSDRRDTDPSRLHDPAAAARRDAGSARWCEEDAKWRVPRQAIRGGDRHRGHPLRHRSRESALRIARSCAARRAARAAGRTTNFDSGSGRRRRATRRYGTPSGGHAGHAEAPPPAVGGPAAAGAGAPPARPPVSPGAGTARR